MARVAELEARVEAALAALEHRLTTPAPSPQSSAEDGDARLEELQAENAQLQAGMAELRQQRDTEIAELEDLIQQLKPLIEEVA